MPYYDQPKFQFHRIASLTFVAVVVETLLTVGICSALVGKLRKIHDIFGMSLEMQKVGACALVVLGECNILSSLRSHM